MIQGKVKTFRAKVGGGLVHKIVVRVKGEQVGDSRNPSPMTPTDVYPAYVPDLKAGHIRKSVSIRINRCGDTLFAVVFDQPVS